MFKPSWKPFRTLRKLRPIRTRNLDLVRLEDRVVPTVYYFHGHNLFGPNHQQNDPYWTGDTGAWLNPYNWGLETAKGIVSGKGVPGSGDTVVFRGASEDGHSWTVYDGHTDANGNYDHGVNTNGGSVLAKENQSALTLNLDRNWGGQIVMQNGSTLSVGIGGGRWQSGALIGNVTNAGPLTIQPDASGTVSTAIGTFTNNGTITQTAGTFLIGGSGGAAPYGGTVVNHGTYAMTAGMIDGQFAATELFQNDGILTGSAGQVRVTTVTTKTGTLESTGTFHLQGPQTVDRGTIRATPGATLNFNTISTYPIYGSVTWSGNVNLAGGGMITATANGGASTFTLSNADLTVAEGTTFTVGNANVAVNGLPRINVTGNGKLSHGSITFVSGTMTGSFENDGTVILAGQSPSTGAYEDNQLNGTFLNRGKLLIQAPNIVSNGTLVNSQSGLIEFQHDSNFYGDYYGGALIQNAGNVQVDAGVKSVWIRAGWDNLGGTIDVKSGSLALSNNYGPSSNTPNTPRNTAFNAFGVVHNAVGLSTGGKFTVAAGATLDLRSTADQFGSEGGVFTGNYTGSGGGTVLIGGNMQMSQSDWNFPAGMLVWGDPKDTGNSSLAFSWTNSGDLTLPSTIGTLSRNLRYGTLTNRGTIEIGTGVRLNLTMDFQPGIAWIVNTAAGTITAGNGSYIYSDVPNSPTSSAAIFRNDGKVLFTGGGTVRTYLENYGTVEVHGGVGIQNPVLDRTSVVPTLTGTWIARAGGNVAFDPNGRASGVTTSSATLIADGMGSQVTGLITLTKNLGTIEAINGGSLSLPGNLTNHGSLIAQSGGQVTIPGKYTQASTGVLTTGIDSNSVTIAGTATLDGLFNAQVPLGITPPSGFSADVLTAKSITGTFAQQNLGGLVSRITDKTVSLSLRTDASDLAISNVKILPTGGLVTPGTSLSVQFTVTNLSGKATQTGWNDTVFLSTDDTLDASDLSLNRQADAGILAANASRTVTIPFTAPSIPGSWVVIVSADSTVAIPDPNRSNNVGSSIEPIRVSAPELPIGVDVAASFPAGNTAYYTVTRNAGAPPIRITATGATMAMRFAEPPMGDPSDTQSKGSPARLDIPTDHGGVYYLAVTRTGSGAVTVRAENASLGITGLGDESNLSSTIHVGDPITLTVIGTGFTAATTFKLGDATASRVEIQSPNQAIITVTAPAAGGPFFVNATTGSQTVNYSAKPFTAIASNASSSEWDKLANWSFQISLPSTIRVFREANVTVTFRNNSATSQPAPLVQLFTDNGRFRLPTGDLLGESMIVLGVKANGRADMYAPGETGSFELVLQPTSFGPHVQSAVYAFDIGERGFSPTASPDPRAGTRTDLPLPAEVIDGLRPEGMADDAWTAVRAGLQGIIGTTYQSYGDALRSAANRLVADGADTHDLGRLNRYLLNVANQFGQLSRRFELTAFGRGVENPYAVSASADATGMVTVSHGFNSRLFASSFSGFTALVPGDRGILTARPGGGYILTEADGSFTAFRPDGLFDFTQNLLGQKTTAAYTNGRLVTLTDFRGDTTTLTYAANGRIATITDPVSRVTTYGFDPSGEKLTTITVPSGTTTYAYSPDTTGPMAFTITGITGPDGVTTAFDYDVLGRMIKTTIGGQQAVTYIYGSGTDIGRVTSTDALSHSISAIYGEFGQLTTVQTTLLGDVDATFNDAGQLSGIGSITVVRDAKGNLTAAVPATGDAVRMSYDAAGVKLTSLRDPLGNATTFAYNPTGQIVSQSDPLGVEQFGYDAQGNPTANVTPGGRSAVATYDSHGLVTKRTYGDGSTTSFTYDAHRNLTAVTDAGPNNTSPKTVTLAYDTADRVTLITYPTGKTVGYHYDSAGRRDRITTSDGLTVGYTFDTLGRLKTVSRNTVVQVTYAFDAAGRLASKIFANGTSTVYTYDAMNRTTRIEHRGTGNTVIDFEAYTYSAEGRVATFTTKDGVTSYAYDSLGQLIGVTNPDHSTVTYTYDANGNRIVYGANAANEYTMSPDGDAYSYDGDGNLITKMDVTGQSRVGYGYDARGRLVSQKGATGQISYEYDPLGNRSAVIINGVRTDLLVDPLGGTDGLGDVLTETTNAAITTYLPGLGVEARFDSTGAARFYGGDLQGSTALMTDGAGAVTATYRYDAFGAVTLQSGADAANNVVRFNGQLGVTDRGTGLLDMRARFYDPADGRFTQQDPLGLGGADTNLYRFAANNPVNGVDPAGLFTLPTVLSFGGVLYDAEAVEAFGLSTLTFSPLSTPTATPGVPVSFTPVPGPIAPQPAPLTLPYTPPAPAPAPVPGTPISSIEPSYPAGPSGGTTQIIPRPAGAPPAATWGQFAGEVALPLTTIGTLTIANAYYLQQNGYAEGNKPGPGPLTTPEWKTRFHNNIESDPLFKPLLDKTAAHHPPTLEDKLYVYRLLYNYRHGIYVNYTQQVTANDPNEIIGPAGFGASGFVQPTGAFPYTIHFENQSSASAPAQVVTVTQQLDSDFDWQSFSLQSFGWGALSFNVPVGLQSYRTRISDPARNAIVDVNANFNPASGILTWTLTTLDPVTFEQPLDSVTAGFLPPNDANGVGQGFVSYSVLPKANTATSTRFDAKATIVFDLEAPLDTAPIFNTADSGSPTVTVLSLPAKSSASHTTVRWNGADDPNGSGIATYDVYTSVNGGVFTLWQDHTTATSAVYTGTPGQIVSFYAVNADHVGLASSTPASAQASTELSATGGSSFLLGSHEFAVGSGSDVNFYNPDGTLRTTLTPFPGFTGGLRTASADFNGDGVAEIVVGTGPGSATHVKIFDGVTHAELFSIDPFEATFTGGVYVAAGDNNGDGLAELAITPDEGGGPRVRVFNGNGFTQIADFFGIDDPNFRGGARAAIGDVNGDGMGDLVVAAGFGGGPRVAAFDGSQLSSNGGPKLFGDFFAFEPALRNGIFLALGDVNGDGFADLVAGGGPGGGPRVYVIDGKSLSLTGSDTLVSVGNFFAGDINNRGGIRVTVKDLDGDNQADIVTGAGASAGSRVTAYLGKNTTALGGTPPAILDFDAFANFAGGVFVG